jgi:hypothetical protein
MILADRSARQKIATFELHSRLSAEEVRPPGKVVREQLRLLMSELQRIREALESEGYGQESLIVRP